MTDDDMTSTQRRTHLIASIARQRDEFAVAYRNLGKPIQYFEYGMRGFGFVRQNPWIFSVLPAAFTILAAVMGIVRTPKPAKEDRSFFSKWTRSGEKTKEKEKKEAKSLLGHAIRWSGHGLKAYRLYKKIRKFL